MKDANVWVICSILVSSLILGFVALPEEPARGLESSPNALALSTSGGTCAPVAVEGVRYEAVDLRFDPESRSTGFSF